MGTLGDLEEERPKEMAALPRVEGIYSYGDLVLQKLFEGLWCG